MLVKKMDDAVSYWFESLDEVMDMPIVNDVSRWHWEGSASRAHWVGCTIEQMRQWLRHGWEQGLEQVQRMLNDLGEVEVVPATASVRRRVRRHGDQGHAVDMYKVWNGHLDNAWEKMESLHKVQQSQKFVSVFINLNTSGSVSWQSTLWRAAAVVKLVDALQRSGRAVRISAGQVGGDVYPRDREDDYSVHAVRIKEFNEPLSLEHLVVACTAMFYRIGVFRMMSAARKDVQVSSSYGNCPHESNVRNIFPHPLKEDELERGAMLVRVDNCYSRDSAIRVCRDVAKQLVTAEPDGRYRDMGETRWH